MAELLTLLFLVAIGYGVYRVVKYVRYRNELARARDRVLAGMANMPDRRDVAAFNDGTVASESGGSVEKGLFSYWCYTSIERDIYNVDAYELMRALNVETLDDLFKTVKERFCYDTFVEFLKDNSIHFDAYAH